MFLAAILLTVCLVWCVQFHWKRRRLYQASWNVPGPLVLPLIGSAYLFFRGDASVIASRFMRLFDEYPDLSKIWLGPDLFYLVTKPEFLEVILNSPGSYEKSGLYNFMKPLIGNGLLSGPVQIWKRHRKIIAPSLNQKILNDYTEKISQHCAILVEVLQKQCGKGEIDHSKFVTKSAVDIVTDTIFGVPFNVHTHKSDFGAVFHKLMEVFFLKVFRLAYKSEFIFSFTQDSRDLNKAIAEVKSVSREIIERKKEEIRNNLEMEDGKKKRLLDLVVEKYLNQEFSLEELEDEVNTFLLAGSDTNATTASFVLTLLGMHQEVQQKLYEEVLEVLGPDRSINLDDLPKLKYTERVVKESLRVFPGAPFISRLIEEDIHLGEIILPKGSNIIAGYLHLHRNEKYWNDPLKFDPDRFLPEKTSNRHTYTWLPFSGGSRNCIGMKYGMMVVKIMTATVIQRFRVRSSIKSISDIELTTNVVLKPKDGFRLAFELR